jgi:prepilin-type N-terminal cleavage/methylation domain-containing protein
MLNPFKRVRGNQGFTLVEVMVAASIGVIILVGIMQIVSYQNRVSKTGDLSRQVDDVKRQFQTWIYNKTFCDNSFAGMRNGDPNMLAIYRDRASNSKIISVGDRIPASEWTVESMNLLSTSEIQAKFPLASGNYHAVNSDGIGTAVIHVKIHQLKGMSGTTQIAVGQDAGAFGGVTRDLYFPIQEYFGVFLQMSKKTMVQSLSAVPLEFKVSTSAADGGLCCMDCPSGQGGTITAYVTAESGLAPTAVNGNNPVFLKSSADDPGYTPMSLYDSSTNLYRWNAECSIYNLNLRIMECANTGSNSL